MAVARALVLSFVAGGCVLGSDKYTRPVDLAPVWLVDRPRVLAVRAEPAEIRPGETALFEALITNPDASDPHSAVWLACPVEGGGIGFGCPLDLEGIDLEAMSPEELLDIGFIGFEPLLPPAYTAPTDLLDGLDDIARKEGAYVLVQVTAIPPAWNPEAEVDFNEIEAAYKRLVVSEATTPNTNPSVGAFSVEGVDIPSGDVVHLDRNQPYELGLEIPDEAIEEYEYQKADGSFETRIEEPYVGWFSTGGELLEEVTLYPNTQADWLSPKAAGSGTWYAVVRDRRGGQTWHIQNWIVD